MTALDLTAVAVHRDQYLKSHDHADAFACCTAHASADDVPDLLVEVERLREVVADAAERLNVDRADAITMRAVGARLREAVGS